MITYEFSVLCSVAAFAADINFEIKAHSPTNGRLLVEMSSPQTFEYLLCVKSPNEQSMRSDCEQIGLPLPNTPLAHAALAKHFAAELGRDIVTRSAIAKGFGAASIYTIIPAGGLLAQFAMTKSGRFAKNAIIRTVSKQVHTGKGFILSGIAWAMAAYLLGQKFTAFVDRQTTNLVAQSNHTITSEEGLKRLAFVITDDRSSFPSAMNALARATEIVANATVFGSVRSNLPNFVSK